MITQELPHEHEHPQVASSILGRHETPNSEGGPSHQPEHQPGLRAVPDQSDAVLSMGATGRSSCLEGSQRSGAWPQENTPCRRTVTSRSATPASRHRGTQCREFATQKGALAITPSRRYSADEKANILATIARAQQLCPDRSLATILTDLGL